MPRAPCASHTHTHTHRLPLSVSPPALTPSPEQSSLPSAQFPGLMGASQMPACLPPRSLPLWETAEGQAWEVLGAAVLASALDVLSQSL